MDAISRFRIAVDIGGTFTDIALLTDTGLIHQSKISSTPADPSIAVVEGVAQLLAELSIDPSDVAEVLHGTTVGSNTILQRKGARTGLITTRGFRDVLEIGRIRMPDMFDLTWDKPAPLVPRRHRLEVVERMAADGSVVEPLSEASVVAAGEALMAQDIESARKYGENPLVLIGMARLGNGKDDELLFVQLQSASECGSAGCSTVTFRRSAGGWHRILDTVSGPMQIAEARHRGMPDLIGQDGIHMIWDGSKYREIE